MPYPDRYFYHNPKIQLQHSAVPEGELDLQALPQYPNIWALPVRKLQRSKKNLILASSWVEQLRKNVLGRERILLLKQALQQLLVDGFSCYAWNGRHLILLQQESLYSQFAFELSNIADFSEALLQKAAELRVNRDGLFILDYHECCCLLEGNFDLSPRLYFSDFGADRAFREKLDSWLGGKEPQQLVLDSDPRWPGQRFRIQSDYPDIELLEVKAKWVYEAVAELNPDKGIGAACISAQAVPDLAAAYPNLAFLELKNADLPTEPIAKLNQLKSLELSGLKPNSFALLNALFDDENQLIELVFSELGDIDLALESLCEFKALKILKINFAIQRKHETWQAVQLLLDRCPNLDLLEIQLSPVFLPLPPMRLPKLSGLKSSDIWQRFSLRPTRPNAFFDCSALSALQFLQIDCLQRNPRQTVAALCDILQQNPGIKLLRLKGITELSLEPELSLHHLQVLSLDFDSEKQSLTNLPRFAPNLKQLKITQLQIDCGLPLLPKLESLALIESQLPAVHLQQILNTMPCLTSLDIAETNLIALTEDLRFLPAPCLKRFGLKFQVDQGEEAAIKSLVEGLMAAAPNLQDLELSLSGSKIEFEFPLLAKLESLNLFAARFDPAKFISWLNAMPDLRFLHLESITFNRSSSILPYIHGLRKLEQLTFAENRQNHNPMLSALCAASPNLYCIELYVANLPSLPLGLQFHRLDALYFYDCTIRAAAFKTLLPAFDSQPYLFFSEGTVYYPASESIEPIDEIGALACGTFLFDMKSSLEAPDSDASGMDSSLESSDESDSQAEPTMNVKPMPSLAMEFENDNDDERIRLKRLFYPLSMQVPEPECYRLDISYALSFDETSAAIELLPPTRALQALALSPSESKEQFELALASLALSACKGIFELRFSQQQQISLPSLSPNDRLLHYYLYPKIADLQLHYDSHCNQYLLSSDSRQDATIFFALAPDRVNSPPVHPAINALVQRCRNFGLGPLFVHNQKKPSSLKDYLRALEQRPVGACGQRSMAFLLWMQDSGLDCQFPSRIVLNDCHVYVEVLEEGRWKAIDLGGATCELAIEDYVAAPEPALSYQRLMDLSAQQAAVQEQRLAMEAAAYVAALCGPGKPLNILLQCPSLDALYALQYLVKNHALAANLPIFIAETPADLNCYGYFLEKDQVLRGFGGDFHRFCRQHSQQAALVLINLARFRIEEILRMNSLFDSLRQLQNFPIPERFQLLCFMDSSGPNAYQGPDLLSRMDRVDSIAGALLDSVVALGQKAIQAVPNEGSLESAVDLYRASNWQSFLLGSWRLKASQAQGFRVEFEAAGIMANQPATAVTVYNAPQGLEEEQSLFQRIQLGLFQFQGQRIERSLRFKSAYDWQRLQQALSKPEHLAEHAILLHPSKLYQFALHYVISSGTLHENPGLLYQQSLLNLYLLRALSDDEWALLLQRALDNGTRLCIAAPMAVELPSVLEALVLRLDPQPLSLAGFILLNAEDPAASIAALQQQPEYQDCPVLDISECQTGQLFALDKPLKRSEDFMDFEYQREEGLLLTASGSLILLGQLSDRMLDALSEFIWSSPPARQTGPKIALILSQEQQTAIKTLSQLTPVQPLPVQRDPRQQPEESYSQFKARQYYLEAHSADSRPDTNLAWLGVDTMPRLEWPLQLDYAEAEAKAAAFLADRYQRLMAALAAAPFVHLTGPTGAGKTSFIQSLALDHSHRIFYGDRDKALWAQSLPEAGQYLILFYDEANISEKQFSEFEGLFYNQRPWIRIENQLLRLSDRHVLVAASNPSLQYAGARNQVRFFQQHGQAFFLGPLSMDFVYDRLLKPMLQGQYPEAVARVLADTLLRFYRIILGFSDSEVLISPRELQFILELTRNSPAQSSPELICSYYCWFIGKTLLKNEDIRAFEQAFSPPEVWVIDTNKFYGNFKPTASRFETCDLIERCLELRHARLQPSSGIGGLLLEGPPGIGKSEMIRALLKASGLIEHCHYLLLPASLSLNRMQSELRRAFDQGMVVIIDELNTIPQEIESLLNALLSGRSPEGALPKTAGFFVFGTENPISLQGRQSLSPALSRRFIKICLPEYTQDELLTILNAELGSASEANGLLQQHSEQLALAAVQQRAGPSQRSLFKRVEARKRSAALMDGCDEDWVLQNMQEIEALQGPNLGL